ncbi:MAG TPA: argininosuccinate lyase [Thermoanaerobaculia bacterium]|nr:argininosuccinate lyase [Thermoanaerobaculia bacterium]
MKNQVPHLESEEMRADEEEEPAGTCLEAGMGRLAASPHPVLFDLLYRPQFSADVVHVLPWLLRIDAAHVVMLARQEILPREAAADLLRLNRELEARAGRGEPVLEQPPAHRGLYFVYERLLVEQLGPEIGGAAHIARSRNDINAAVTRLRLRQELLDLLDVGFEMLARELLVATERAATAMSGFSHFQPAQPATFGHYLAAVGAELLRSLDGLAASYDAVNRSPMGAGAGLGTSFPIDRELTASLLGFEGLVDNSLDAVASRDYAVQALSPLAMLGITLTRLALDLQIWSSPAYGFLRWPDDLVSTSSMMPQKRNVFVLENVRGQAARPASALIAILLGLKNTPFSNSVEVSSEVTSHLWPALAAGKTAIRLTTLALGRIEVDAVRMRDFLEWTETTMTAVADHLVACHGLPFRTAHEAVGRFLRQAPQRGASTPGLVKSGLEEVLRELSGRALPLDEAEIGRALDPLACIQASRYGGGPSLESVESQLARLSRELKTLTDRTASRRLRLHDADLQRTRAVEALL